MLTVYLQRVLLTIAAIHIISIHIYIPQASPKFWVDDYRDILQEESIDTKVKQCAQNSPITTGNAIIVSEISITHGSTVTVVDAAQ